MSDVIPIEDRPAVLRREIGQIATRFAAIPDRKNLIWIGYQFPVAPPQLQKLKAADVAVDPVDAQGSLIGLKTDKELAGMPLRALAAATGGVAAFDRDDIEVAVREAIDDGRFSYTLGFYSSGGRKCSRGSSARDPNDAPGRHAAIPIPPTPSPFRSGPPRSESAILQKQGRLNFDAVLDVASLNLVPIQNRWTGKIELVAQFMAADGSIVGDRPALAQTVNLKLRQSTYDQGSGAACLITII